MAYGPNLAHHLFLYIQFYWNTDSHLFMYCIVYILLMATFMLQEQNYIVVTEAIWLTKPKLFSILPFKEKICQPLV